MKNINFNVLNVILLGSKEPAIIRQKTWFEIQCDNEIKEVHNRYDKSKAYIQSSYESQKFALSRHLSSKLEQAMKDSE